MGAREVPLKVIKIIVTDLEKQGCHVRESTKGYFIKFPSGETTVYHKTPSDHRAWKNNRARVRRNGLRWPLDSDERAS